VVQVEWLSNRAVGCSRCGEKRDPYPLVKCPVCTVLKPVDEVQLEMVMSDSITEKFLHR